jgi:hypothetical protein
MNSIVIAGIIFVCTFGGAIVGYCLQRWLPEAHLKGDSKEVIKLGTGLVATMAALVLGLLVGAAKSVFDSQTSGFQNLSANIILLDKELARCGPEAQPVREQLRRVVESTIAVIWPTDGSEHAGLASTQITKDGGEFYDSIRAISPQNDLQRSAKELALETANELGKTRWLLSQQATSSLPTPFFAVLAFWMFVLFGSFGLFSPRNITVFVVLFVCAASVAGAVFLVVDMDQPFEGLLQISSEPLRNTLTHLGR